MEKDDLIISSISDLKCDFKDIKKQVDGIEIKLALLQQKTAIYASIAATVTMGIWQFISSIVIK